ncbi:MAG TPA: DUF3999 family protein [Pyrinomonadaceae bacterium]|nr:DUF3999 family protein [Pyrinomonadaceae bacterium]
MKRACLFLFLLVAATVLVVSVSAQTSLSQWPYYVEVTPEKSEPGIYQVALPIWVMDKARPDLGDLRLFDSNNGEIPYGIRIRREVDEKREIPVRLFNAGFAGAGTSEASVDLGENHGEHNEIEIQTRGENFRRQVVIEGSDSGSEWRTLNNDGVLFSFASQNNVAESRRVTYPTSRYRYLRVKVSRDQLTDHQAPEITNVKVTMAVREKGWRAAWNVPVPSYQLLRNQGAHASAWIIDIGARTPCDQLSLAIADESFSRPFQVEAIDDDQNVRLVATGDLTRRVGDQQKPLVIVFNQEEKVRQFRLQITDYSNPTLDINSIDASAPARELVFELKAPQSEPLRLFVGNANVTAPHYDFEKELQARLATKQPVNSAITTVLENREYKPEPLPLTERIPWLIYLVLAASSIALGIILFSLARTATKLNPQTD